MRSNFTPLKGFHPDTTAAPHPSACASSSLWWCLFIPLFLGGAAAQGQPECLCVFDSSWVLSDEVNVQHHDGDGLTFPRDVPDQPIQPGGTRRRRRRGARRQGPPGAHQETHERLHGVVPGPAQENGTGEPQDAQLGDQQEAGGRVEGDDGGGEEAVHRRGEAAPGHAHEGTPGLQVPAAQEDQDAAEEGQVLAGRGAARLLCGGRDGQRPAAGQSRRPPRGERGLRVACERLGERCVLRSGGGCRCGGARNDAGGAAGVHATPG